MPPSIKLKSNRSDRYLILIELTLKYIVCQLIARLSFLHLSVMTSVYTVLILPWFVLVLYFEPLSLENRHLPSLALLVHSPKMIS